MQDTQQTSPASLWQEIHTPLPELAMEDRVRSFLARVERKAVRECTANYTPLDRQNYRHDPAAQAERDRPVIAKFEASLLDRTMILDFPIWTDRENARKIIARLHTGRNAARPAVG